MKRALAALAVFGVLVACGQADSSSSPSSSSSADRARRHGPVLMYGDSLLESAKPYVQTTDQVRAFGGTALCDWVDNMAKAASIEQPSVMVIEFVGNSLTPCMNGYTTPQQIRAKYEADAQRLKERVSVPMLWVGPPLFRDQAPPTKGLFDSEPLFVDAGATVLQDGKFASMLPCLPDEGPSRGCGPDDRISVRAADGTHFGVSGGPYLSGARRFANAIDEAVNDRR